MFDIHCHLEYMENPEFVIEDCKKKGMSGIISSIANPKDVGRMLALKRDNKSFLHLSAGFHPHHETEYSDAEIDNYIQSIQNSRHSYIAIGEVGLDYTGPHNKERQQKIFEKFIILSKEIGLPLVIHCREAFDDVLMMLEERDPSHVVFHCFSGSETNLKHILSHPNWFVSFATNICYTQKHPRLAKIAPLNRMLLETDSPWLDPDIPEGQKRELTNRPWKISSSAEVIARLKGMSIEEVLDITTENAKRVFGII